MFQVRAGRSAWRDPPAAQLPPASALRFVSADGRAARIEVVLKENPFSGEALDAVPELRTLARQSARSLGLPEGSVLVGGDTAESYDTRTAGDRDSLVVLPLILLAIGVVLALLLRSLIAPLYLMASIAFTYFATLGLAVFVFVLLMGHAGVGPAVPFFLFVFLNALSVDYNIYLMSRIREEAPRAPLKDATRHALARTGPVITSAGLILAGTFSALMTLPLQDLLQLGFGVAVGVLIDTFITRTLIVPALVTLIGRWNWWPSRIASSQDSTSRPPTLKSSMEPQALQGAEHRPVRAGTLWHNAGPSLRAGKIHCPSKSAIGRLDLSRIGKSGSRVFQRPTPPRPATFKHLMKFAVSILALLIAATLSAACGGGEPTEPAMTATATPTSTPHSARADSRAHGYFHA